MAASKIKPMSLRELGEIEEELNREGVDAPSPERVKELFKRLKQGHIAARMRKLGWRIV